MRVLKLTEHGQDALAKKEPHFAAAINTNRGVLTNQPVAQAHNLDFEPLSV